MAVRVIAVVLACLMVPGLAAADPDPYDPHDPNNLTWLRPGVFALGGGGLTEEDVLTVKELGARAVANFRSEYDDPRDALAANDITYYYEPIDYALDINVSMLEEFIVWAKEQEADGRPIYAHCISAWHRAAAFGVAWLMEREGLTYDHASREVTQARAKSAMRVPGALLQYEAKLKGQEGLHVFIDAEKAHPLPGESMDLTVTVYGNGQPVPGATLRVWTEKQGTLHRTTTDEDGRFTFTYTANATAYITYLYARASAPGFVDGADGIEMYHFKKVPKNYPFEVEARLVDDGIGVVVNIDGTPVSGRIMASTPDGWATRETTMTGLTTLPRPPKGGEVTVLASRFGEEVVTTTLSVPKPPPTLPLTTILVALGVVGLGGLAAWTMLRPKRVVR